MRRRSRSRPSRPVLLHRLCSALIKLGRYKKVVAAAERALELEPSSALAYNNLGVALQALDRQEESEQAYRGALEHMPEYPQALSNLGVVLQSTGRKEEAEECYRRVIGLSPDYAEAHNNHLGHVFAEAQPLRFARQARGSPKTPTADLKFLLFVSTLVRGGEKLTPMPSSERLRH